MTMKSAGGVAQCFPGVQWAQDSTPSSAEGEKEKRRNGWNTHHLLTLNLPRDYSVALNKLIQAGLQLVEKHTHTSGYQIIPIDR